MSDKLRMDELSAACGITPRNIRRYITLGLIAPPAGRTRSATYDASHLADLFSVRTMLLKGLTLLQVKEEMLRDRTLLSKRQSAEVGALLRLVRVAKGVSLMFEVGGHELPKSTQDALVAELATR